MASLHRPSIALPIFTPPASAPPATSHGRAIVSIQLYQRRSDYPGSGEVRSLFGRIRIPGRVPEALGRRPSECQWELGQVLPHFTFDAIAIHAEVAMSVPAANDARQQQKSTGI
jgi:hypothetical protein